MDELMVRNLALRVVELERRVKILEERTHSLTWSNDTDLEKKYVLMYGEHVDKTVAAKILDVTRATVYTMLADGRIQGALGGSRVDVRSIARYVRSSEGHPRTRRGKKKKEVCESV